MITEAWKPIPDLDGYEVSDLGNVRSWRLGHGKYGIAKTPKLLSPVTDIDGYKRISLVWHGKNVAFFVHKLVLLAFLGPCPEGMECSHANNNKQDNRPENLNWVYTTTNRKKQTQDHLCAHGESHAHTKLTEDQVVEIRYRYAAGEKARQIGLDYGIDRLHVNRICRGYSWKHAPGPTRNLGTTRGEANGLAKLTEEQVIKIRQRFANLEPQSAIAAAYGLNPKYVSRIAAGKTWTHVGGPITIQRFRKRKHK